MLIWPTLKHFCVTLVYQPSLTYLCLAWYLQHRWSQRRRFHCLDVEQRRRRSQCKSNQLSLWSMAELQNPWTNHIKFDMGDYNRDITPRQNSKWSLIGGILAYGWNIILAWFVVCFFTLWSQILLVSPLTVFWVSMLVTITTTSTLAIARCLLHMFTQTFISTMTHVLLDDHPWQLNVNRRIVRHGMRWHLQMHWSTLAVITATSRLSTSVPPSIVCPCCLSHLLTEHCSHDGMRAGRGGFHKILGAISLALSFKVVEPWHYQMK